MQKAKERAKESFVWFNTELNISAVLDDIAAGRLRPKKEELDVQFVEQYATSVLALKREQGAAQKGMGIWVGVDAPHALELPDEVLDNPVIFMHVGAGKGILVMDGETKPGHVLADGNHRVTRAYLDGRERPLSAYVLSPAQSRRYRIN